MNPRLRIGVSACLLGEPVRYDGHSKRNRWVCSIAREQIELIPVCPEVATGMGIPRPPIQLVETGTTLRALGRDDPSQEFTAPLQAYARKTALAMHDISGFIFKSRSPSCGLGSTPIYRKHKKPRKGSGLFAQGLTNASPLLPVMEETDLDDSHQRRHFLEQAYAYHDWQSFLKTEPTRASLLSFHQQHRLQLMAHGLPHLRTLERLLQTSTPLRRLLHQYGSGYMSCLRHRTTTAKQLHVLAHLCRPLQQSVSSLQWEKLQTILHDYRHSNITLHRAVGAIAREHHKRGIHDPAAEHYFSLV